MNLPQVQEAQDALRSKSLDEREASILERERLLDDTDRIQQLELLDKQIALKQDRISNLDTSIESLNHDYQKLQKKYNDAVVSNELQIERASVKIQKLTNQIESTQNAKQSIELEVKRVNDELQSRRNYLEEQEKIVNTTIADWNIRLGEFQHECMLADEQKKIINTDIIRLEQLLQDKTAEIQLVENRFESLQEVYERKKSEIKEDLAIEKAKVLEKSNLLQDLSMQYVQRSKDMETREQALSIKEVSLNQKDRELQVREQRLNLKIGLTQSVL